MLYLQFSTIFCSFQRPVLLGDVVRIETETVHVGRSLAYMKAQMYILPEGASDESLAEGKAQKRIAATSNSTLFFPDTPLNDFEILLKNFHESLNTHLESTN